MPFDPSALPDPSYDLEPLVALLHGKRVMLLAGAGCSTESGIPDYRGPETKKKKRNPIQYLPFVRKEEVRARYWARSAVGWPKFRLAEHNATHSALAALEHAGLANGLVTQNVDGLHQRSGSSAVVELHGALGRVVCLQCLQRTSRDDLQRRLREMNPDWPIWSSDYAPDGDADLGKVDYTTFSVPDCSCGGILKPDVVFFGENVPKPRVQLAWDMLDEADALLVVGSSLTVWSGYRFVRKAAALGKPVAIVGLGETRGDTEATLLLQARCGRALPELVDRLRGR